MSVTWLYNNNTDNKFYAIEMHGFRRAQAMANNVLSNVFPSCLPEGFGGQIGSMH